MVMYEIFSVGKLDYTSDVQTYEFKKPTSGRRIQEFHFHTLAVDFLITFNSATF